jgi:hypothetical protein
MRGRSRGFVHFAQRPLAQPSLAWGFVLQRTQTKPLVTITHRLCPALAIVAVVGLMSCGGAGSADVFSSSSSSAVALSEMVLVFAFTMILVARFLLGQAAWFRDDKRA